MKALDIYKKEIRDYPHSRSFKNVSNLCSVWGSEIGYELSEKFYKTRQVL